MEQISNKILPKNTKKFELLRRGILKTLIDFMPISGKYMSMKGL